jgi:hypothetical protein
MRRRIGRTHLFCHALSLRQGSTRHSVHHLRGVELNRRVNCIRFVGMRRPMTIVSSLSQLRLSIVPALYSQYFQSSAKRPWNRTTQATRTDAIYRLSVTLSAPILAVVATIDLVVKVTVPGLGNTRWPIIAFAILLFVISTAMYLYLDSSLFDEPENRTFDVATILGKPGDSVVELLGIICIGVYCVLALVLSL